MVTRQGRQLVVRAAALKDSMSARIPDLSIKILKLQLVLPRAQCGGE